MKSREFLRNPRATIAAATAAAIGVVGIVGWGTYAYSSKNMIKTEFTQTYLDNDGCLRASPYGGPARDRVDVDGVAFPGRTIIELTPDEARMANAGALHFIITPDSGPGFRFEPADKTTNDALAMYGC
jgi:hypothetical protein